MRFEQNFKPHMTVAEKGFVKIAFHVICCCFTRAKYNQIPIGYTQKTDLD